MSRQSYKCPNSRPYVPLKPSKHQKAQLKNQKNKKSTQPHNFGQMIDSMVTNLPDQIRLMSIGECRSILSTGSLSTGGLSTGGATRRTSTSLSTAANGINVPRMFREDISALETRYRDMDAMTLSGMSLNLTTCSMPLTTIPLFIGAPIYLRYPYQRPYLGFDTGASRISNFYDSVRNGTVDNIIQFTKTEDDRKLIMRVVCSVGRADMFDYLVSIGIKPDDACLSNSFENPLFDRIIAMGTPSDESFHWACGKGNLTNFNKLLYVSDINHEMQIFGTPLRAAVENNHTDIALTLLSLGAKPQDNLKYAVENDNEVLVTALIKHGAEVTDYCKGVATPKVRQLLDQH